MVAPLVSATETLSFVFVTIPVLNQNPCSRESCPGTGGVWVLCINYFWFFSLQKRWLHYTFHPLDGGWPYGLLCPVKCQPEWCKSLPSEQVPVQNSPLCLLLPSDLASAYQGGALSLAALSGYSAPCWLHCTCLMTNRTHSIKLLRPRRSL